MTSLHGSRRAPSLLLLGLALAACCPGRQLAFETPEAALASWQSQLCHDELQAEYVCLAYELKLAMGGFPTYVAARHRLLEDHPFAAAYLKYGDLVERDHERVELGPDRVRFDYTHDGQAFALGFQREAWLVVRFRDGRAPLVRRLDPSLVELVRASGPRQWIELPRELLSDDERAHVAALEVDGRWKIASVDGLLADAAPPPEPRP